MSGETFLHMWPPLLRAPWPLHGLVSAIRSPGLLWAAGAVLLWSQSAACLKFVLSTTPWLSVALWSSTASAVVYGIAIVTTGRTSRLRSMPARELAWFAGIGLVGYFLYTCFIYVAYASGPASEVLIVNYLWPVATVVFAARIAHERPSQREIGGLGLALLGVITVITRGRWQWPQALGADLLALGAALCYGLYSAVSKRLGGDRRVAFVYLTPVLGLLWLRMLFASEAITVWVLAGLVLIVAGFLVQFSIRAASALPVAQPPERNFPS